MFCSYQKLWISFSKDELEVQKFCWGSNTCDRKNEEIELSRVRTSMSKLQRLSQHKGKLQSKGCSLKESHTGWNGQALVHLLCPVIGCPRPQLRGRSEWSRRRAWGPDLLGTHPGLPVSPLTATAPCRTALCRWDPPRSAVPRRSPSFCIAPMRLKVQLSASW